MTDYSSFLKNTFLFKGMAESDISALIKKVAFEEQSYQRTEAIFSPDDFERRLGFVVRGECTVGRQSGGGFVPLNTIGVGGSFGILSVFSIRDEFPTVVKAKNSCTVLFFSANAIRELVTKDPTVSMNVIEFLARKISFLNDKIASFSGGSVEEKLAGYILELQHKHNSLTFDFNKKKSAEALNCGRASLYRAIASLEEGGYISFEDKKIIINDHEGLERILK
jgi:CRP-like cAMP-binding protein